MNQWTTKLLTFAFCCSTFVLQACSPAGDASEAEIRTLHSTAFSSNFNVHDQVGDVNSLQDSIPASKPFHVNQISESIEIPIRDCTVPGLYEMEKQMALNAAAADASGSTVPVKFSYSFGKKHDVIAKAANKRAVLSKNNGGISYIPVGGRTSSKYGKKHAYYTVDNTEVARQYSTGERCFFSTINVDPNNFHEMNSKYDFIEVSEKDLELSPDLLKKNKSKSYNLSYFRHMIHYMHYGYCKVGRCDPSNAFAGEYANRLFREVPSFHNGEPQIIKLYMADLRSEQMAHDIVRISEETTRGLEIDTSIDNILNVCKVHENFHSVTKNLSLEKEVNGYQFDPIQGAVQLVENILSHDVDGEGTVLSTQYTPIVIDLDGDGVKTSSVRWGTYFNMAALDNQGANNDQGQSHRTAWLGGHYQDYNSGSNSDPRVNLDVRIQSTDGFLVVPDANNQVTSSTQMFGDNITIGGKTYENGFLALQAFSGKNCESSNIQDRYVGPWDGDIYSSKLKIWVDENRNGVSDDGEIRGLKESKVAAINACHIVHQDENDHFGNGTHLRSAVLMAGPYPNLLDRPEEILFHLERGHGYEGERSYFNLAIDLIFKVDEENRCPAAAKIVTDHPAILPPAEPIGIPSNEPVSDPIPTTPSNPSNF